MSFSAILKRFAALSAILRHLAENVHVLLGSRQMDRTKVLEVLEYMVYGRSASPLSIGIYWDCFGSVSIGTMDGIFPQVLSIDYFLRFPDTGVFRFFRQVLMIGVKFTI